MPNVKLVITAPLSHSSVVRDAIGKAGAGKVGNYEFCTFSSKGTGRFRPLDGAHPAIGEVGKLEAVEEERIEVTCPNEIVGSVIEAIKKVHPYEEPVIDVYPIASPLTPPNVGDQYAIISPDTSLDLLINLLPPNYVGLYVVSQTVKNKGQKLATPVLRPAS